MGRKDNKKRRVAGWTELLGNRKSVGVFLYAENPEETEINVILQFVRPIEKADFNPDGSIKICAVSSRRKGQLATSICLSETCARALHNVFDKILPAPNS